MTTTTITLSEFCQLHGITMSAKRTDRNPGMADGAPMDHWRCNFRRAGVSYRLTCLFSMGLGHHGKAPTAEEVLSCLAMDASGSTEDFSSFCSEFGYDEDSRTALRTFKACQRITAKLHAFLTGAQYEQLLYGCEQL